MNRRTHFVSPRFLAPAIRVLPWSLALLLIAPISAIADTLRLKSGETVEGRITQSDASGVTIEVQVSSTIIDERTISRSDIANLAVESGDEIAYARIRGLKSPDTLLTAQPARALLTEKLFPFLKEFPNSPRVADVNVMVRAVESDLARLKTGDLKIFGTWYDKATFAAEKYQIEAATVLEAMRQQLDAKNYPAAINSFELLQRSYPNSDAYAESVPLAASALVVFRQQLAQAAASLPIIKAQRQAAIDRSPIQEQPAVRQAVAVEDARAAATAAVSQRSNRRFYQIFSFDEKGIASMQTAAAQAAAQIKKIDQQTLAQNVRLLRQTRQELAAHQLASAQASFDRLKMAWNAYEGLSRLDARLKAEVAEDEAGGAKSAGVGVANPKPR